MPEIDQATVERAAGPLWRRAGKEAEQVARDVLAASGLCEEIERLQAENAILKRATDRALDTIRDMAGGDQEMRDEQRVAALEVLLSTARNILVDRFAIDLPGTPVTEFKIIKQIDAALASAPPAPAPERDGWRPIDSAPVLHPTGSAWFVAELARLGAPAPWHLCDEVVGEILADDRDTVVTVSDGRAQPDGDDQVKIAELVVAAINTLAGFKAVRLPSPPRETPS
jgi:hypothetical protein